MTLRAGDFFSFDISKDCGKRVEEKRKDRSRISKCIRNIFWTFMTYKKQKLASSYLIVLISQKKKKKR